MIGDDIYYPSDPLEIRALMQRAVLAAHGSAGTASIVVCPFGAWSIGLPYIASAMRACSTGAPRRVLLIGPPSADGSDEVLLPESSSFATPLGELPVETDIISELAGYGDPFRIDEIAHLREHSLEIVLPALHYMFGPLPIIPLLVPAMSPARLSRVASILRPVVRDRETIVVVTANLSGFAPPLEADARARKMVRLLMTAPGETILRNVETFEEPPRSIWPMLLGHLLAPAAARPTILSRGTFETEYHGDVGTVVLGAIAYESGWPRSEDRAHQSVSPPH